MGKRVFLFVLDSFGIGEAPDAADFGDAGASTVRSVSRSPHFSLKNLTSLGFSHIDGLSFLGEGQLRSRVARLKELSRGKDTTIGHWEIAGVVSKKPLPTFPDGFPPAVIDAFTRATGRGVLCNKPYSGTAVIRDYGEEQLRTEKLIVYTSADSVFQIAAHEDLIPPETLYEYCREARKLLTGEYGVGRVIARPFAGEYPFTRTPRRHDFSMEPPQKTMLDELSEAGLSTIAVGKIHDIFAGRGISEFTYTSSNAEGIGKALAYQKKDFCGLCFINLVDFDMLYGHRRDTDGYAAALAEFDSFLPDFLQNMKEDDALIITADHGCDPGFSGTDHTREYVPFLLYGKKVAPENCGTLSGFFHVADEVKRYLGVGTAEHRKENIL